MVIGVDFDNTLICYDDLFFQVAQEAGLLPPHTPARKRAVRDAVRQGPQGDLAWQRLQALVYGARIQEARPMPGALAFMDRCLTQGVPVHIISHKTEFSPCDPERVNLRQAALGWLEGAGLFGPGRLPRDHVHFGATRAEKLAHIRAEHCTHFIDDLEEVFLEPEFPRAVEAILFAPGPEPAPAHPCLLALSTWPDISRRVFHA